MQAGQKLGIVYIGEAGCKVSAETFGLVWFTFLYLIGSSSNQELICTPAIKFADVLMISYFSRLASSPFAWFFMCRVQLMLKNIYIY